MPALSDTFTFILSGKNVLIVNGSFLGEIAALESIDEKNFCCSVSLKSVSVLLYFLYFESLSLVTVKRCCAGLF